jgi:hypothetical protein
MSNFNIMLTLGIVKKQIKGLQNLFNHIWTFAFGEIGPSHHVSPRCWCHDEHWMMISIKKTNVMFNMYMVLRLMKDQEHKTYFFIIVHIRCNIFLFYFILFYFFKEKGLRNFQF